MHSRHAKGIQRPQIIWTYNRRDHCAKIAACQSDYAPADYHTLVHPGDRDGLLQAIKHHLKFLRGKRASVGEFVNRHRIRTVHGDYRPHLSLITVTRDDNHRLAFVFGVDYRSKSAYPQKEAAVSELIDAPLPTAVQPCRRQSDRDTVPFLHTWICAGFVVAPSLFRMARIDSGELVELSARQARFIALLLGARDSANAPVYVERATTREQIFETDPGSRLYDNDIDQIVKFFRLHFGRAAIATKRGYGHILRANQVVCDGDHLPHAVALLSRDQPRRAMAQAK